MQNLGELIEQYSLKRILEGLLGRSGGVSWVVPADDSQQHLFLQEDHLAAPCRRIRSIQGGEQLCRQNQFECIERALSEGGPIVWMCHAGLMNLAVPVTVEGELLATIFWGQGRPWNMVEEEEGLKRAENTERNLGIGPGELVSLRTQVPVFSEDQVEKVKGNLWTLATYLSSLTHDLQRLENARQLIENAQAELDARVRGGIVIQKILVALAEIVDIEQFWLRVDDALEQVCDIIGAVCAVLGVCRKPGDSVMLKAVAKIKREEFVGKSYAVNDPVLKRALQSGDPTLEKADWSLGTGTIVSNVSDHLGDAATLDQVGLVPVSLSSRECAIMVFFFSKRRVDELRGSVGRELDIVALAAPHIAVAYQNCQLFQQQRQLMVERDRFLQDVSHQLVAPLTGIQAHAENLLQGFDKWDHERIESTLQAIVSISRWAARLARNFAWATTERQVVTPQKINANKLLLGSAIGVQGLAATKGIRIQVDTESLDGMSPLLVDRLLFNQAVDNLLDNAIKYSDANTIVTISGSEVGSQARICITNFGIPIRSEDTEKVFERGYRTKEASVVVPAGTGLGLSVAREIIRLHEGELLVTPSVYDETKGAYRTTFSIILPTPRNDSWSAKDEDNSIRG